MKATIIELVSITGLPVSCYQTDDISNIHKLYPNQLLSITNTGLVDYQPENATSDVLQKYRFVIAKNPTEREVLLKVETMKIYLRRVDMVSKILHVNPYASVRWLKGEIEKSHPSPFMLVTNENQITNDSASLIQFLNQNSIVHIIQKSQQNNRIGAILIKQPNSQNKYSIKNVDPQQKVKFLIDEVSRLTGIPQQFLFLVYGGKILPKDRIIREYNLRDQSYIYAVDSRRYLRKITQQDWAQIQKERLMSEKEGNKTLVGFVRQEKERIEVARKEEKEQIEVKTDNLNNDDEFFSNHQTMEIDTEQAREFNHRASSLEQQQNEKVDQIQEVDEPFTEIPPGTMTPPNSPIYLFNRSNQLIENKRPTSDAKESLAQGRIKSEKVEFYTDQKGIMHEHDKSTTFFKNGTTKIQHIDIAQDRQGNILQVQRDLISIKTDPLTGNIIQQQSEIIEDPLHTTTTILKKNIIDTDGNSLVRQTNITTEQQSQQGTIVIQSSSLEENGQITTLHNQYVTDGEGAIAKLQSDLVENYTDDDGFTHMHSKDVREQNGVTIVIEKTKIQDGEGHIVQSHTDIIKTQLDECGNIHKHEHSETDHQNELIIVERDLITNVYGVIIAQETDMKIIEHKGDTLQIVESDMKEDALGSRKVIETKSVTDQNGNVIDMCTNVQNICTGQPGVEILVGQKQPVINGGTEIQVDSEGNTHIKQKHLLQKQGKTTIVNRETVQNSDGHVILVNTHTTQIEGDDQGNMHKHSSQVTQQNGYVNVVENDTWCDADASNVKQQSNDLQVQVISGNVIQGEIDEQNKRLMEQETQIFVNQVQQAVIDIVDPDNNDEQEYNIVKDSIEEMSKIISEDFEGLSHTFENRTLQTPDGTTKISTETVVDSSGHTVKIKTNTTTEKITQNGMTISERQVEVSDDQLEGQRVTITESNNVQDLVGETLSESIHKVEITEEEGIIHRKETDVMKVGGEMNVYNLDCLQDQEGNLIDKNVNSLVISGGKQAVQTQAEMVARAEIEGEVTGIVSTYETDSDGNFHVKQKETIKCDNKQIIVEHESIEDQNGEIVRVQTEITTQQHLPNGKVEIHETEIIEQNGHVKVVEYAEIRDQGNGADLDELLGLNEDKNETVRLSSQNEDLLLDSEATQDAQTPQKSQSSNLEQNVTKRQQNNLLFSLLDDSFKKQQNQIQDLPIQSSNNVQLTQQMEEEEELEEYNIFVVDKSGARQNLTVRYDDIIDEVAKKLSEYVNQPKDKIKFYKDGQELQEYDLVSEVGIGPNCQVFYLVQEENQQQFY